MQGRDSWARMAEPFELEATGKQGLGHLQTQAMGAPGGSVVRSPLSNVGDMGLIPGPRGSHMPRSRN